MQIELRWQTSCRASCFHAAAMLIRGVELAESPVGQALSKPASNLKRWLGGSHVDPDAFFDHLIPLSLDSQSRSELAKTVTNKTVGRQNSSFLIDSLVDLLETLEIAYGEVNTRMEQQAPQPRGPLETQWRASGRGLMAGIAKLTDEDFLVTEAGVILVHPVTGGAGRPFLFYNKVLLEVAETDPVAALPEVLGLAWLLSTLNLELPRYSENLGRARLRLIGPLAMIPIVLAAAESAELARCNPATVWQAVAKWGAWPCETSALVDVLGQWWGVYSQARPPLSAALEALDLMVDQCPSAAPKATEPLAVAVATAINE